MDNPWADEVQWTRRWRYLPRLLHLLWQVGRWQVGLFAALVLLHGSLPVGSVVILRYLVDTALAVAQGTETLRLAVFWLGLFLLVEFIRTMIGMAGRNRWLSGDIEEMLKAGVQQRLLEKAARLPLEDFERPAHYDRLHRVQAALDRQMITTFMHLFNLPAALITVGGVVLYVGAAHPLFPVVLLVGLLPGHIGRIAFRRRSYQLGLQHGQGERFMAYVGNLLSGREHAAEIRLFGLQNHLLAERSSICEAVQNDLLDLRFREFKQASFSTATSQITFGLVLTGVVALIARGSLSAGYYVAFLQAAERFRGALSQLLWAVHTIDADLRYVRDLLEYLDLPEEQTGGQGHQRQRQERSGSVPEVRFQGVEFCYPGAEQAVLKGIDLVLRPGERVALVGVNGAGKTTLAKLLLGLYRPTAGCILVDGVDLATLEPAVWRQRVSAVFQDYQRYALTLRENIGFGALDQLGNDCALQEAALHSGMAETIKGLALGYDTPLGRVFAAEGVEFSVGQWQRLAIARAYLRQAAVLVLDEPTAALDARAEVDVYQRFGRMATGRTVLFISHRLGATRLADRILFLAGGRIVEEGSHAELMQRTNGQYAPLFRLQAQWYRS